MNTTLVDDMGNSVTGCPELCIGFGIIRGSRNMAHCNAQRGEGLPLEVLLLPAVRYVTCLTCECDTTIWHQDQNLTTRTTPATNQSQCQCHRDGGGGAQVNKKGDTWKSFPKNALNCLTKLNKHDKLNCNKPELSWCRVMLWCSNFDGSMFLSSDLFGVLLKTINGVYFDKCPLTITKGLPDLSCHLVGAHTTAFRWKKNTFRAVAISTNGGQPTCVPSKHYSPSVLLSYPPIDGRTLAPRTLATVWSLVAQAPGQRCNPCKMTWWVHAYPIIGTMGTSNRNRTKTQEKTRKTKKQKNNKHPWYQQTKQENTDNKQKQGTIYNKAHTHTQTAKNKKQTLAPQTETGTKHRKTQKNKETKNNKHPWWYQQTKQENTDKHRNNTTIEHKQQTKTRKHIQQNTHKKHQKNKKQTQTKSWKNTRVPLEKSGVGTTGKPQAAYNRPMKPNAFVANLSGDPWLCAAKPSMCNHRNLGPLFVDTLRAPLDPHLPPSPAGFRARLPRQLLMFRASGGKLLGLTMNNLLFPVNCSRLLLPFCGWLPKARNSLKCYVRWGSWSGR